MKPWQVTIADGTRVAVRRDISQMSTFVLLEQEDWFEDEISFVRRLCARPGLALDIGANHGVYALSMASSHTERRVVAFEPTPTAGPLLAAGIAANRFEGRVEWKPVAVADRPGYSAMSGVSTPELAALTSVRVTGAAYVPVMTLDGWWQNTGRARTDFVKLDVEGSERNVVEGGRTFFEKCAEVVMFEIKHGDRLDLSLVDLFVDLGFTIWRLAPGIGALVPYAVDFDDPYLLNLFAVRPEREAALEARGLLVSAPGKPSARVSWTERLPALPYAEPFLATWLRCQMDSSYQQALELALAGETACLPAGERLAALEEARHWLIGVAATGEPEVDLLRCRVADALGRRQEAVAAAAAALEKVTRGQLPRLPFVPPAPLYDRRAPADNPHSWLWASLYEFLLTRSAFSSFFARFGIQQLLPAVRNPNRSLRVDRMFVLASLRDCANLVLPGDHPLFDAERSPNAVIWQELCLGRPAIRW